MSWSFDKASPVYMQIADTVRRRIACGMYPKGAQIPPVRELALEAAVNPNTVQRAFLSLEGDGLIETRGTSGRFVTSDDELIQAARDALADALVKAYYSDMASLGIDKSSAAELANNYLKENADDGNGNPHS